jgi:tRNA-(ms[2]io[6]A)-hydroxylase
VTPFRLACPTPAGWLPVALADLDAAIADHLHCERKATASALSLLHQYPGRTELVRALSRLAHEESRHVMQVAARLRKRGTVLTADRGDVYAQKLRKLVRRGEPERQLDMLLCSALIEARSAERLGLLAGALEDPSLAAFYGDLARVEEGHRELFLNLARPLVPTADFDMRLAEFIAREAEIVADLPLEPRIH